VCVCVCVRARVRARAHVRPHTLVLERVLYILYKCVLIQSYSLCLASVADGNSIASKEASGLATSFLPRLVSAVPCGSREVTRSDLCSLEESRLC